MSLAIPYNTKDCHHTSDLMYMCMKLNQCSDIIGMPLIRLLLTLKLFSFAYLLTGSVTSRDKLIIEPYLQDSLN